LVPPNKKYQFVGGRWGFVDRGGAEAIPVKLVAVGRFSGGLAAAAMLV
jgi:hypothetical protein